MTEARAREAPSRTCMRAKVGRTYAPRPVTRLEAVDKGPKFVDHGGRYPIFLRRLRELIPVTRQRGNAAFIRKWLDVCVPRP